MAGYTKSYNKQDNEFIESIDFQNEYGALELAFDKDSGHLHDGSVGNGSYVPVISDSANLNEIVVDSTGNQLKFLVNVAGVKTEQLRILDGIVIPSVSNDVDLGTVTNAFKNLHIVGTGTLATLALATGASVTSILDDDTMVADSDTALVTQQSIKAYTDTLVNTHVHDGVSAPYISLIASSDNLNTVEVNGITNDITLSVDVAGVKTNKLRIDNTGIYPAINLASDLGAVTNKFNNFYTANANVSSLALSSGVSVTQILDEDAMGSDSATALVTQQSIKAYVTASLTSKVSGTVVPATAKGSAGDTLGQLAGDATYIYLCHTTWVDGVADIWSRTALATW